MCRFLVLLSLIFPWALCPAQIHATHPGKTDTKILRRENSFFGLHFDFHATEGDTDIGKTLTLGMVDSLLEKVKPDFIQVDCKGHPGISSYPTKVGNPAPSIVRDPLKIFREATLSHHVGLYVHYSGIKDAKAIGMHKAWAAVNQNGLPDRENVSSFSPYADSLLVPQLEELVRQYNIDGAWVDGDCWALNPDYSSFAAKAWHKAGYPGPLPLKGDSAYSAFKEFNRKGFREYLARYVNRLHAYNPEFQIASNWAYSSMMPEKVDTRVDFLSGDLASQNSMNSGAFEARCLASQGKPWDLMAWGFTLDWNHPEISAYKSALQLEQEAAEVIAMGGGFQIYITQKRDASLRTWLYPLAAQVAGFVRERQPYCEHAEPIHQIAVLYPTDDFKRSSGELYNTGPYLKAMLGLTTALLDGGQTVELRMEHSLTGHTRDFGLIVVPECEYLSAAMKKELLDYTRSGGKLLLVGTKTARLFETDLGVSLKTLAGGNYFYAGLGDRMTPLAKVTGFDLKAGTTGYAGIYADQDMKSALCPAASLSLYGKGTIASLYANVGETYVTNQTGLLRDIINGLADTLFTDKILHMYGSHLIHAALNRVRGKVMLNLINTDGQSANPHSYSFDQINPVQNLVVTLRLDHKPQHVLLRPGKEEALWTYAGNTLTVRLKSLKLHCILEIS